MVEGVGKESILEQLNHWVQSNKNFVQVRKKDANPEILQQEVKDLTHFLKMTNWDEANSHYEILNSRINCLKHVTKLSENSNNYSKDGIQPFKEKLYYDTFEYHWYAKWNYFFQRTKKDFDQILKDSGIPQNEIKMERDDSGVILFYVVGKA